MPVLTQQMEVTMYAAVFVLPNPPWLDFDYGWLQWNVACFDDNDAHCFWETHQQGVFFLDVRCIHVSWGWKVTSVQMVPWNQKCHGCLTPSGLQWHWWYVKSYQSHLQACLPTFHRTWYASNPTNLCHYKDTIPSVILVALLHCDVHKKIKENDSVVLLRAVFLKCLVSFLLILYCIVFSTIYF